MKAGKRVASSRSGWIRGLCFFSLAFSLAGCAGYRVGSLLPAEIQSVHVLPVDNQTGEPLLEAEVARLLLAQIQFDGSLRVADAGSADALLRVQLRSFRSDAIGYRVEQDATPDEYRVRLEAVYVLSNRETGAVIVQSRSVGESTFQGSGNLTGARTDAIPAVSRDLARRIVSQLVEAW
ncbi:MAG: LPS assembly lipoprotein LptE [Kiritimatiellia bacterium]|nr:LPS assembly lipoprotein LptE [Kiritimatiellia bacterium]